MTSTGFPFLTAYDPPGNSEGTLDPMGLYQIADQLAVKLVPSVRERMQRLRFLTAMAVGALVTEDIDEAQPQRDASPYLVWEWLVVEALIRPRETDEELWGVPGMLVTRRALERQGYLDARSYLKTPRIFGFNGVYKRLAIHLGLVDVHLAPGPNAQRLVDAWAHGLPGGASSGKELIARWRGAVRRSLAERPARTKPGWNADSWGELAQAFAPGSAKAREKRCLHDLLHAADGRRLGALPVIWRLLEGKEFDGDDLREELLHERLVRQDRQYEPLIAAIRAYEAFARGLQDGFDVLKTADAAQDVQGFSVPEIRRNPDFVVSVTDLPSRFTTAHAAVAAGGDPAMGGVFLERFRAFGEPMDAGACALALCRHHEEVQRGKSADGKRPWFDRLGSERIYVRHAYRKGPDRIQPDRYVHGYRGGPIRRFHRDLR